MTRLFNKKASSAVEYMILVVFILAALFVMRTYIINAFMGGWKKAADTFGHGKQYDPRIYGNLGDGGGTLSCFFDDDHCRPEVPNIPPGPIPDLNGNCPTGFINTWIDQDCFDRLCDCTLPHFDPAFNILCLQCLANCRRIDCGSDMGW